MNLLANVQRGFAKYWASAIALIAANLVPLFGVLFLGWNAFAIVAVYWAENMVICVINVLKMITCSPDAAELDWSEIGKSTEAGDDLSLVTRLFHKKYANIASANFLAKLFFIPFFIFQYVVFAIIQGFLILALFDREPLVNLTDASSKFYQFFMDQHLAWAVVALAVIHLVSFAVNYLWCGEYRRTVLPLFMYQPYGRIVVLQVTALLGGFVVYTLGSPVYLLVPLVVGKTILDLEFHIRERERTDENTKGLPDQILGEAPIKPRPVKH